MAQEGDQKSVNKRARPTRVIGRSEREKIENQFKVNGEIPAFLRGHIPSRLSTGGSPVYLEDVMQRST